MKKQNMTPNVTINAEHITINAETIYVFGGSQFLIMPNKCDKQQDDCTMYEADFEE